MKNQGSTELTVFRPWTTGAQDSGLEGEKFYNRPAQSLWRFQTLEQAGGISTDSGRPELRTWREDCWKSQWQIQDKKATQGGREREREQARAGGREKERNTHREREGKRACEH